MLYGAEPTAIFRNIEGGFMPINKEPLEDFASQAQLPQSGFVTEFWGFLKENKKWWLGPILIALLLIGILLILGGTAAAPFIYTLF